MQIKKGILILSIILVVLTHPLFGQISPGGVGTTNLTAWFRSSDLSAGNVTTWTTQYPTGAGSVTVTDPQSPYPQLETTPTGFISNYNNTINFSGNSFSGLNLANVKGLSNANPPTLLKNAYSSDHGSYFCSYYLEATTPSNGHMTLYNDGSTGLQCRNLNTFSRVAIGHQYSNTVNASRDWNENNQPNIISYEGNRSSSTSMKAYNKGSLLPTPSIASQSTGADGLYFGYSPSISSSAYNGFLNEIIFFNRDLTPVEMNKVHTYLAIKYGVTLDNQLGGTYGDYTATDGTLIWDADAPSAYHHDVIGIGRDDVEDLMQKQSHSFDDSIRVYIDNLQSTNQGNTGTINTNISYIVVGHNNGLLCGTPSSNAEAPAPVSSRIDRELKITNTNFNQNFNLDIKLDTCSSIAGVDLSQIRLLVDDDGDFTNDTLLSQADGITFSVQNGVLSIKNISPTAIPVNQTRFVTVGYIDEAYTIASTSGPVCIGEQGWVVFHVMNNTNPVTIQYSDGTNNYTATNIQDGDTLHLPATTTTTYSFTPFFGLINCCSTSLPIEYEQEIDPLPTLSITASDDTLCLGEQLTLTGSGAGTGGTYTWDNGVQNGVAFTPSTTTNYTVTGTTSVGCESTLDTLIEVLNLPTVSLNNPTTTACVNEQVTYTATGAQTYVWNLGISNGVPFTNNAGTYNYQVVGTDAYGCKDTANVTLVVDETPTVNISGLDEVCRGVDLPLQASSNAPNATFSWSGGGSGFLSNTNQPNVIFNDATAGSQQLIVTATNQHGCKQNDTLNVTVTACGPPTAVIVANKLETCPGTPITLSDASYGDSLQTWNWTVAGGTPNTFTGKGPQQVTYSSAGSYKVVLAVTNFEGTDYDTITVTVDSCIPPTVSIAPKDPFVCEGDCNIFYNQSNGGTAPSSYHWYVDNNLVHTASVLDTFQICFDDAGSHSLTVIGENIYGSDTTIVNYPVKPLPIIEAFSNSPITYGDTAQLDANSNASQFLWTSNIVTCDTCKTTFVSPKTTTTFMVIATSQFGCVDSANTIVRITYNDFVGVPDNFSPNGDGHNDILYVKGYGIKTMTFRVFNRYGQKVFESDDQKIGWDGRVKGKLSNSANFVYTLDYTLQNNTIHKKEGTIRLVR